MRIEIGIDFYIIAYFNFSWSELLMRFLNLSKISKIQSKPLYIIAESCTYFKSVQFQKTHREIVCDRHEFMRHTETNMNRGSMTARRIKTIFCLLWNARGRGRKTSTLRMNKQKHSNTVFCSPATPHTSVNSYLFITIPLVFIPSVK